MKYIKQVDVKVGVKTEVKYAVYEDGARVKLFDTVEDAQNYINSLGDDFVVIDNIKEVVEKLEYMQNREYIYTNDAYKKLTSGNAVDILITDEYEVRKGKAVEIEIEVPLRCDSTGWGGAYINVNAKIGDTWYNLGNGGYDGNSMYYNAKSIARYTKKLTIPKEAITEDTTVQVELIGRTYNADVIVNSSHDINREANGLNKRGAVVDWTKKQNFTIVKIKEV